MLYCGFNSVTILERSFGPYRITESFRRLFDSFAAPTHATTQLGSRSGCRNLFFSQQWSMLRILYWLAEPLIKTSIMIGQARRILESLRKWKLALSSES
ncbi:hypothetical protein NPIL_629261 [Nephila pilipes]|uniref:Uncharacterized protein n=1 Tax=Nephila pilipes TaxID=299642 RepID=A0A8X6N7M3_NEPPI|nr:hypothetical protein NPIL_629261 [Nephila pilipes]